MIDCPLNRTKVKRGSQLYNAKLTELDVSNIRKLLRYRDDLLIEARSLSAKKIAEKYEVSQSVIEKIAYKESWLHVE